MEEVAAAARCASPPSLPTCLMLEQLFPSAAGISACVPSADGLGVACVDLLPRACAARCPAGCAPHGCGKQCGKLVEPLPGGGLLAFALAHPPSEVERSLMEAFAAALSDQLRPRGTATGKVRTARTAPGFEAGRGGQRERAGGSSGACTLGWHTHMSAPGLGSAALPLLLCPTNNKPLTAASIPCPLLHSFARRIRCCRCLRRRRCTPRPPARPTTPFGLPSERFSTPSS